MVLLTREQLEDRLAALHRTSLELVSNLSLETVLERIVMMAREQGGARYAALGVVNDDGDLEQFIPVGMTKEEIALMPHQPIGRGLLGIMSQEGRTVRIPEICADPRSVGFPPNHPQMHSFLGVPILSGDKLLGQLYLTDKINYHEFTGQDERVIETLAAYAAVAISNARLYEELVQRDGALCQSNEDLKLLNDVAAALTSSRNVEDILEKTLDLVMDYLEVEAGEIFLREEDEQELRMALHRGDFKERFSHLDRFRIGQGFVGMVAATGKMLVSTNLREEMRYLRPEVLEAGFRSIACIPLSSGGKVVGVMAAATRRDRLLDERELNLLTAIGAWAGLTIENLRLDRQSRRLAVLEERERIGMDLHDGIIQSIYGVGLALDFARMAIEEDPSLTRSKIEESIASLNATIKDIRSYILDLRPRQFHGDDLKQNLQRLVDEFQANSPTRAILVGPEDGLIDFPAPNSTALFHICQESLANIARHSRARLAEVHLWTARERVLLEISDDGLGFDLSKTHMSLGHGLSNMQARARKVGGDVEITSASGEGTTVLAWVPRRARSRSNMDLISSRNNPKIKLARALRQRKARQESGLFVVEGIRPVGEAVQAGAKIDTIFFAPDILTSEFARDLVQAQAQAGVPCFPTTPEVFAALADKENPQGLLALVHQQERSLAELNPQNFPWGVALVAPQDPGNLGTILRTVEAVGASGLLLLDSCVDLYHPNAVRASMGAMFWLPVVAVSFADFTAWSRGHGYCIYGTSAQAQVDYRDAPAYAWPRFLLLGSEREGLTEEQMQICDLTIRVPMRGRATSLNLAVAAGVMLYAMLER